MSSTETRSRTVIFRLTEREYTLLKRACSRESRSLSEFARVELLAAIEGKAEGGEYQVGVELSRLRAAVEELKELVLCLKSRQDYRQRGGMRAG